MPSLHYLGLVLFALLPLASFAPYSGDAGLLYEPAGAEPQNEARTGDIKWYRVAKTLHNDIWSVRDEQFVRDFGTRNMTDFASVRIEMPLLTSADGCVPYDFSPHKCLRHIYAGLQKYQVYLPYVERENLTAGHMLAIKEETERLLNFIKGRVKVNDDRAHPSSLTELPDDSAWIRKIVTHSILYNFKDFMADTSRAITYMSNLNVWPHKLMKHVTGEERWLLKHKQ